MIAVDLFLVHMDVVLVQFFFVWKFWFVVAAQADKLYVSTFLVLRQFCFACGSEVALITCCRLDWFLDLHLFNMSSVHVGREFPLQGLKRTEATLDGDTTGRLCILVFFC